jgi:hypothetical protein
MITLNGTKKIKNINNLKREEYINPNGLVRKTALNRGATIAIAGSGPSITARTNLSAATPPSPGRRTAPTSLPLVFLLPFPCLAIPGSNRIEPISISAAAADERAPTQLTAMLRRLHTLAPALRRAAATAAPVAPVASSAARAAPLSSAAAAFRRTSPLLSGEPRPLLLLGSRVIWRRRALTIRFVVLCFASCRGQVGDGGGCHAHRHGARARGARGRAPGETGPAFCFRLISVLENGF